MGHGDMGIGRQSRNLGERGKGKGEGRALGQRGICLGEEL